MIDITNGQVRLRAWPKPRGKKATPAQQRVRDTFAIAQWLWNYLTPEQQRWLLHVTQNTPLLPRDILTALIFNRFANILLPDGRIAYPMPFRAETSAALDTITQTVGHILVRGANGWEGQEPSGGAGWQLLLDQSYIGTRTETELTGLEDFSEIRVFTTSWNTDGNFQRRARVAMAPTGPYLTGASDYLTFNDNEQGTTNDHLAWNGSSFPFPMSQYMTITQGIDTAPTIFQPNSNTLTSVIAGASGPISRLRLYAGGGLLSGGRIVALAR